MITTQKQAPEMAALPKFTGKQLVMINDNAGYGSANVQAKNAGLQLATFSDYGKNHYRKAFQEADGIVFEQAGVAVINPNRDRQVSLLTRSTRSRNTFKYSEQERYVYALSKRIARINASMAAAALYQDTPHFSWGIQAINVPASSLTGKNINLAILDTGFSLNHPDFAGRIITSQSFVPNEKVNDKNGHGSHCTGISSGHTYPQSGMRYGVAHEANIYIGKVLSNKGYGVDGDILAGMEWALSHGCKIISLSLGAATLPGETYSRIYDDLAKKALDKGTLIIAAAGNESDRDNGLINPICHPANCPNIMAVAAVDPNLQVAYFSCGGTRRKGGKIDIAAPGIDIFSTWKSPKHYETISGTSMATPYVAGIAALYWQANPQATAHSIWNLIIQNAKKLTIKKSDVGAGLIQAP